MLHPAEPARSHVLLPAPAACLQALHRPLSLTHPATLAEAMYKFQGVELATNLRGCCDMDGSFIPETSCSAVAHTMHILVHN